MTTPLSPATPARPAWADPTPPEPADERPSPVRLGMVLDQPFPAQRRVEREALALAKAGYQVHLLCPLDPEQPNQSREEAVAGVYIHRVNLSEVTARIPLLGLSTRWPYQGPLHALRWSLQTIDAPWQTLIDRFVTRFDLDILHIHGLRLGPTGLSVARGADIPCVLDLPEPYPLMLPLQPGTDAPQRAARQLRRWEGIERRCLQQADRILVPVEEDRERLLAAGGGGVSLDAVCTVSDAVDPAQFEALVPNAEALRKLKPYFVLTALGQQFGPADGLHTVLDALVQLRDELPEVLFVVAGDVAPAYGDLLTERIERLNLAGRVAFTGSLPPEDSVTYLEAADLCLCPSSAHPVTEVRFPPEVYLYHLMGKPVLASDCTPLKRYLVDTGGGVVYRAGDTAALADQIRRLYRDSSLRRAFGESGRRAVLTQFNWPQAARRLVQVYDGLVRDFQIRPHAGR